MDIKSHYTQAVKLSSKGEYAKAVSEFDKIIKQDPNFADAYSDRGVAKYHLNDLAGSLEDLNKALELEPENPYRYASRAYIRDRAGDTRGAVEDYRKALELEPENAVSQNNLGMLEEKLGYIERAQKRFKIADKLTEEDLVDDLNSIRERDEVVKDLLEELDIHVKEEEKQVRSLVSQMFAVFRSKEERKDFYQFVKKFLRIS